MINPFLIPRLNLDYSFRDLVIGLIHIKKEVDLENLHFLSNLLNVDIDNIYFTGSGRVGLYTILKSLDLPTGSKIGVQLFTCPVVFDAIVRAGYIPFFLDIDTETYTLDINNLKENIDNIDALIVIHTFGHPADIDNIRRISGDIPIIEDCAHSLLAKYKGQILGTLGDASFFSFGPGKYISAGGGGMIIINNHEILNKPIEKIMYNFKRYAKKDEILHVIYEYVKSVLYHRPMYGLFSYPIGTKLDERYDFQNKWKFELKHVRKSDLSILLSKLPTFQEKVNKYRENTFYLIKSIKNLPIQLPVEKEYAYDVFYLFPILFDDALKRETVYNKLLGAGVDAMKYYSDTIKIAKERYGYTRNCVTTESIINKLLVIPHYYPLKRKDLNLIIRTIRGEFNESFV